MLIIVLRPDVLFQGSQTERTNFKTRILILMLVLRGRVINFKNQNLNVIIIILFKMDPIDQYKFNFIQPTVTVK